ncbi:MAG: TIGR03067 domain-containing protein [Gammaproteobacteria bacterium]
MNPRGAPSELDGTWVPIAADVSGQVLAVRDLRVARLVLDRGGYEIIDRSDAIVDRGDIRIDRSATPPTMDIVGSTGPNAGRTMLAIFELDGDRLKVCYDLDGAVRPTNMQPQEEQLLLSITYARAAVTLS